MKKYFAATVHPDSGSSDEGMLYYPVDVVDARIAELEKALTKISNNVMCPQFFREIAANALMVK